MSEPARGFFVTGTDTGVGKTVVSCALVRALRAQGSDVGAMKPVETGVTEAGPLDAIALRAAAGNRDPLDEVCPQRFALPAAPTVAADAEGRSVDIEAVHKAYAALVARHELMIVEGAGGMLVPAADGVTMVDLAGALELPLVLVARAALGTINHTLLSLEVAELRNVTLAGVVISHADGPTSDPDLANLESLRQALGERLVGEIPHLESGTESPAAEDAIDLGALLHALVQARAG